MTKVTGWDNGLSQDYDKGLGRWFANRLGARQQLRKDFEMTQVLIDRSTLEQLVGALESLDENTERPPERNCSCHISPPCGDCVDHSPLRESLVLTKEALTAGRAALANAEPAGWKPIETAPKDGTSFMAGWFDWPSDPGCNMCPVKRHMGAWWESGEDYKVRTPTHWMPLPSRPGATL